MDSLIIILMAVVLCLKNAVEVEEVEDIIVRETRLNSNFYVDENAFMEVAHALGFGNDSIDTCDADMDVRVESDNSVPIAPESSILSARNRDGSEASDLDDIRVGRLGRMDRVARVDR